MTKLEIISGLWSAIYDIRLRRKSEKEIDNELNILEHACRRYVGIDDEEKLKSPQPLPTTMQEDAVSG